MRKLLFLILLCLSLPLVAETFPVPNLPYAPLSYICQKTDQAISIDGLADEPDWDKAAWTSDFVDIEGSNKPLPYLQTRVKLLNSDKGLYIFADLREPHIWAKLTNRDDVVFFDNDFEVFLDPNDDTHEYYEWEINAYGTLWDLFILRPYRDAHRSLNGYDTRGIQTAIHIDGTLNDPSDVDTGWTVEMFIPFDAISEMAHMPLPPKAGDVWRLNFSRVEWETQYDTGSYVKIPGAPESNWVWSPQGLIAMHYPERWGFLVFSDSADPQKAIDPSSGTYAIDNYLRELYYRQKQFYIDNQCYASKLKVLDRQLAKSTFARYIKIETTSLSYVISYSDPKTGITRHIREDGLVW